MLYVDIKKKLGDFRLDVSFAANSGVTALLGGSGCGKSMTLKCIAGVERPDSGRIVLGERVLFDSEKRINLSPQKRRVGYIFQNYALFPNMTVEENITFPMSANKAEKRRVCEELLSMLCLTGLEKNYPNQLSGGQQQRVALARTIANKPEVLMLDEPLSALDSYLKWQTEQSIADVLASFEGTCLLVSHDRDEVYRLSDEVVIIDNGRSEPKVGIDELFEKPATLSAALLSGCKNFSSAEYVGEHTVCALDWGIELHTLEPVPRDVAYIGIRAHFINFSEESCENGVLCDVQHVVQELFSTTITLIPKTALSVARYKHIRVEVPKKTWQRFDGRSELWLQLPQKDLMLLRLSDRK